MTAEPLVSWSEHWQQQPHFLLTCQKVSSEGAAPMEEAQNADQSSMFPVRFGIYLWDSSHRRQPRKENPSVPSPAYLLFLNLLRDSNTCVLTTFLQLLAKSHLFCGLCHPCFTSNSLVSFGIFFSSEESPLKPPPSMFHIPIRLLHQCSLLPRNPGRNGGSGSPGCVIISY